LEKVCESTDNSINYFVCDINKDNDIKSILNQLDKVDTLINCAGIISSGEESEKYDSLELNNIIDTNLKGTLSICLQMIDKWKDDNIKGNIINIGSIASKNGSKYFPLYASAKAGIIAFSKSIAARYGEFGIRCNVISPGVIKTPMSYVETPNFDDYIENIENRTPLKRLGKPNDIAKVALFLDSDNSEFITGQEIVVDGGYTLSQE
jgi:NAD(P)-dependent dehydrogenase (short-subunit alcohol dehydrogenase family)